MRTGRATAISDTGRRRLQNEDAFVCEPPLFAVADGMGGAQAGEIASRIAAASLEELGRGDDVSVADLVRKANARVWQHAIDDPAVAGMGTTVTVAYVREPSGTVEIGHVGDSRAYRIRDGALEQLTADHTLVAELVRSGRLTKEEAEQHPQRSVITRALGTEPDVEVDTFVVEGLPGDLYLICSDGLTSMVRDETVLAAFAGSDDLEKPAETLVRAANQAGGEDNITVVLFELIDGEPDAVDAAVAGSKEIQEHPPETEPEAEHADETASAPLTDESVRVHGAGPGGRAAALATIALVVLAAALILWWSLGR